MAVPAAVKAAATTRMSAGACRFRTLITDSRESPAASAPEGSGTSQVRQASRGIGHLQPDKAHKTAAIEPTKLLEPRSQGPHKVAEIPAVSCYVSRDRERPKGTDLRRRSQASLRRSSSPSSRRPRPQDQADASAIAAGPGERLDARTHTALLDLYALDSHAANARSRRSRRSSHKRPDCARQRILLVQQLSATRRRSLTSQRATRRTICAACTSRATTDPLAVVLGAQSLDDAITQLDDLTRVADQSKQVVVGHERGADPASPHPLDRSPRAGRN